MKDSKRKLYTWFSESYSKGLNLRLIPAGQKNIEFRGVKLWNEISKTLKNKPFLSKSSLKKIC